MKLLFFSDAHGYEDSLNCLIRYIEKFQPDQIIMLGDALYHGPRNPIRQNYGPQTAVSLLNQLKGRIIAVRGNCDCEVDQMLLEFPMMNDFATLLVDRMRCFLTHGHIWNPGHLPPIANCSVFAYGHTHIPQLERREDGGILLNPGSISLPKNGFPPSFAVFENGVFHVRKLEDGSDMMALSANP